jgi:hypothetical protein
LADLEAEEYGSTGLRTRGLLIRRHPADGTCAYFTTGRPAGTTLETLAAVEGQRWTIEDSFETGKAPMLTASMPQTSSIGQCRNSVAWLRDWPNGASNPPMLSLGRSGDWLIKPLQNDRM